MHEQQADTDALDGAVRAILDRVVLALDDARDELDELDAVASDGNHGSHVLAGAAAAQAAAREAAPGEALGAAAAAWGAADGSANRIWGAVLGGAAAAASAGAIPAVDAALAALERSTEAHIGDKSIVDTLAPALGDAHVHLGRGEPLAIAMVHAAGVAEEAATETAAFEDRYDASSADLGYPDPGAASSAVVLQAVADVLAERDEA